MYYFSDKSINQIYKYYYSNPQGRIRSLDEAKADCKSKHSELIGFHELIENEQLRKRC